MNINNPSKVLSNKTIEEEVRQWATKVAQTNEFEADDAKEEGDDALASQILSLNENIAERAVSAIAEQSDAWFATNLSRLDSVISASFQYLYSPRRSENFDQTMVISGIETKNARIVF